MKLVVVTWMDSASVDGWSSFKALADETPCLVKSSGFLLKKSRTAVHLVGDESDKVGNRLMVIPKGCIISMEEVGYVPSPSE